MRYILMNPKMCGNILFQRTLVTDHVSKKQVSNRGELPMYLFENTHEGIVSNETFEAAQIELRRRDSIGGLKESEGLPFRQKIDCDGCGKRFYHTSQGHGMNKHRAWVCGGRDKRTGLNCKARVIPEPTLMAVTAEVLGLDEFDDKIFAERIDRIIACDDRRLTFVFNDGSEVSKEWHRRKPIPYSKMGFEKRKGRNICYSRIGNGNGKVGERRKKKEAEQNAKCSSDTGKEA